MLGMKLLSNSTTVSTFTVTTSPGATWLFPLARARIFSTIVIPMMVFPGDRARIRWRWRGPAPLRRAHAAGVASLVRGEIAGRRRVILLCGSKGEHAIDAAVGAAADFGIDENFVAAGLQDMGEIRQPVHRHPRAVSAALARRSRACGGRLEEAPLRRELAHLMQDAVVGGDDEFLGVKLLRSFDELSRRADHVGQLEYRLRRLGMRQHFRLRALELQLFELEGLELVVHDAGAAPQQHVGAGLLLNVAAQMAIGRP